MSFGYVNFNSSEISEIQKSKIDAYVLKFIEVLKQRTIKLVAMHFKSIEKIAKTLLQKEVLNEIEMLKIIS